MDGLDLRLETQHAPHETRRGLRPPGRLAGWLRRNLAFLIIVVAPTLITAFYFAMIAAPQYVSEAQFVVRGQSSPPSGALSSLLQTAGGSSASEDTYAVQDYMMSRDAAEDLVSGQNLKAVFDRRDADFFARFPNFHTGTTFEHFYRYYQSHVVAELDTNTGISTLTVRTFDARDSQRIARALLNAAERLVNEMNQRQRENTISSSAREVTSLQEQLKTLGVQVAEYRNREALLDPNKQSVPMLKDISDLQAMLTATRVQIAQLTASAPGSPLIPVYQRREAALKAQIARSNTGITGDEASLVPKITTYDSLMLQRELLEKQLATAAASLEAAKAQANRQLLFLDEIAKPNEPDYAAYPRGLASTAVVFVSLLGLFLMGRLLISGAREHQIF